MRDVRWQRVPLYVGGLMGPFGTTVILPMFPELRASFDVSSRAIGWSFTLYLLPFAALLLISGTLGEKWGRRRTVRGGYLLYVIASLVCAMAPNLATFIAGRIGQGVANAFITPLLVAGLAELTEAPRLGRVVGVYSSFQALGGVMAPLVGGIAADVNWRYAFIGTALAALVLAMAPPLGEPRADAAPLQIRPLLTRRMVVLGIGAFAAAAGPVGASILVGVTARDELGVSGSKAGVILLAGATSALCAGPLWGRALDRFGPRTAGVFATTSLTVLTALLGFTDRPSTLAVGWAAAGAFVGFVVVVLQAVAVTSIPDNRGGALSFVLAFRFLGHSVGPIVWLAVIESSVRTAFLGAASLGLVTVAVMANLPPTPAAPG